MMFLIEATLSRSFWRCVAPRDPRHGGMREEVRFPDESDGFHEAEQGRIRSAASIFPTHRTSKSRLFFAMLHIVRSLRQSTSVPL